MYHFDAESSCAGCSPTDEYISINAGYLGAVDTALRESILTLGLSAPNSESQVL